ncbi:hypothetical protein M378DRAFT_418830 [Amanita muscaria Koide BX008]|uniref:Uncharacterized protein n=1 Tax=Amanita muscaria (strain Koide BX008) TaxID=946122 RepID=A0A0C2W7L7_AMAMK|nr:hypothetical protein M378DRAFT_418830 [Amanita muscaria Koide BX008]
MNVLLLGFRNAKPSELIPDPVSAVTFFTMITTIVLFKGLQSSAFQIITLVMGFLVISLALPSSNYPRSILQTSPPNSTGFRLYCYKPFVRKRNQWTKSL